MMHFDVFNGDADGLCALVQLRLHTPRQSRLITGVKRDIKLLQQVSANPGDSVTALDISLDSNRAALVQLLQAGVSVEYFDHHFAGDIPHFPGLQAMIDTSPQVCTSLLVDRHLAGAHRAWAITAAFGDNLIEPARALASEHGLSPAQSEQLMQLGQALNYNAYGESMEDLRYPPAELARLLIEACEPFRFIHEGEHFAVLTAGLAEDMTRAQQLAPLAQTDACAIYLLPDAAWSRRVSGMFANALATAHPQRAHAIVTHCTGEADGAYAVSVRSPVARPVGADAFCRQFPSGGGRSGAAGINRLPHTALENFVAALQAHYSL